MDRNCNDCNHKPVCRLWYSEVESRFAKGQSVPLEELDRLNKGLAIMCKFWKEKD